jgi:uncharacterized protein YjbJ (UPF0337 family)
VICGSEFISPSEFSEPTRFAANIVTAIFPTRRDPNSVRTAAIAPPVTNRSDRLRHLYGPARASKPQCRLPSTSTGHHFPELKPAVPVPTLSKVRKEGMKMDKDRVAGGVKKVTGTIKESAGRVTGDQRTEAEGKREKTEGRAQTARGHAKDAAREILKKE